MVGGADMNETRVHKGDVMIRYVMESCELTDSSEIVMVGDRENDMNGAKQNHMESVGPLWLWKPRGTGKLEMAISLRPWKNWGGACGL